MAKFLPYGRQTIDEKDVEAVSKALRGDLLTTGPLVSEYESKFAAATGAKIAVSCNSGTAALHLAMIAVGCGPGDVVIVPSITFVATANVVRMVGAEVVFADVDPLSGLMTAATLSDCCARAGRTVGAPKAMMPVHLNGQICDLVSLTDVAPSLSVIEDACHALGVPNVGATVHSDVACFSTHPVKAIATGEGGVATTSDAGLAEKMSRYRNHGLTRNEQDFENRAAAFEGGTVNPWYYEMHDVGWNYRLPDILCALGISQLKKLDYFWRRRADLASLYDKLLLPLGPAVTPVARSGSAHGWHLYPILIDFEQAGISRAKLMADLRSRGIGTQVHYFPVHRQPYYRDRYGSFDLPGADAYYSRCLSIPLFPQMTEEDVHDVVRHIRAVIFG